MRRGRYSLSGYRTLTPGHSSHPEQTRIFFTPPNFLLHQSYYWCELKAQAKFQNPRETPSGRKVTDGEREREDKE